MVIQDVVQGCRTKLSYKAVIQGCCTRLETPHIASSLPSCCLHMNKSWWDEVYTDVLAYMYKLVHGNCVYPRVDWQISTCGYDVCFNTSLSSPSGWTPVIHRVHYVPRRGDRLVITTHPRIVILLKRLKQSKKSLVQTLKVSLALNCKDYRRWHILQYSLS